MHPFRDNPFGLQRTSTCRGVTGGSGDHIMYSIKEIEVDQEVHANTNNVPFLGKKYTLDGFCKEAVDNYSSWSDAGEHLYYCLADRFETLLQRDLEKWTPRSRLS